MTRRRGSKRCPTAHSQRPTNTCPTPDFTLPLHMATARPVTTTTRTLDRPHRLLSTATAGRVPAADHYGHDIADGRAKATTMDGTYWDYTCDAQQTRWLLTTAFLFVARDGNDNVVALVDPGTGSGAATYEHDPFGNKLVATGAAVADTPHRFSTTCRDTGTADYYYGQRFYSLGLGRWLPRPPAPSRS